MSFQYSLWMSCVSVKFCDDMIVNLTVHELLPAALPLLIQSLLRVMVKMPPRAVVHMVLLRVNFLLLPHQDRIGQLLQGWRKNWVDFGCMWFRDGLRYICPWKHLIIFSKTITVIYHCVIHFSSKLLGRLQLRATPYMKPSFCLVPSGAVCLHNLTRFNWPC